jgi:N-methylhydantoinase B
VKLDAPAGAHGEVRKRAVSVMLGALAQVVPDLVSGDLCGTSFPNAIGGRDARRQRDYVYYEAPTGGNGAWREGDGANVWGNIDFGNVRTIQAAEALESAMPLRVDRSELRQDSGGEGATRGGLGLRRDIRLLEGEARHSVLSDRAVVPPFGMGGAGAATPVKVSLCRDGHELDFATPGKVTGSTITAGDVVVLESAGGGGYGDPLTRDAERVRRDVRAGYVSAARARQGYGVVLTPGGEVDAAATASERARLAARRLRAPVAADERDPYEGRRGRHRVLRVAPALARRLGVETGALLELLGRHPAPLRAWVRVDPDAPAGQVALDALGRRILGVVPGDAVEMRSLPMPPIPGGLVDR